MITALYIAYRQWEILKGLIPESIGDLPTFCSSIFADVRNHAFMYMYKQCAYFMGLIFIVCQLSTQSVKIGPLKIPCYYIIVHCSRE